MRPTVPKAYVGQLRHSVLTRLQLTSGVPGPVLYPLGEMSAAGMLPSSLHGWIHKVNRRQAREGTLGYGVLAKRAHHRPTQIYFMASLTVVTKATFATFASLLPFAVASDFHISLKSSFIPTLPRVFSSTFLTMTAQYRLYLPSLDGRLPETTTDPAGMRP